MEHDWIVVVTYNISDAEARRMAEELQRMKSPTFTAKNSNTRDAQLACFRCEMPAEVALAYDQCPGEPVPGEPSREV